MVPNNLNSNDTYWHILSPGTTEVTKRKILTLFFTNIGYFKKKKELRNSLKKGKNG